MDATTEGPSDVGAERAVLSGIAAYGEPALADASSVLDASSFTDRANQVLFACMGRILSGGGRAVDYPSVLSAAAAMGMAGFFDKAGEARHLRGVLLSASSGLVRRESVVPMALRVKKLEVARQLRGAHLRAWNDLGAVTGEERTDEILGMAEGPLFELTTRLSSASDRRGVHPMGEGAVAFYENLYDDPREAIGIPSGFPRWDVYLGGGLLPNSVNVVAARPGEGKSWTTDKVGLHVAGMGIPVLNLDTEMSQEEHLLRIASMMTGERLSDVKRGRGDRQKVVEAGRRLADMPYSYVCINGVPFEESLAHIRRWVHRTVGLDEATGRANPCLVVYDYLKMASAEQLTRAVLAEHQLLGIVTASLKDLAARYNLAVLALTQLNREGISREDQSVVSQSDRIAWFGTSLTLFKPKEEEELAEAEGSRGYSHKFVGLKTRHGERMRDGDYINVLCDFARGRMEEGPTRYELQRDGSFPVDKFKRADF